nr:hypothetical protein CFP56_76415 [Quercus suber]
MPRSGEHGRGKGKWDENGARPLCLDLLLHAALKVAMTPGAMHGHSFPLSELRGTGPVFASRLALLVDDVSVELDALQDLIRTALHELGGDVAPELVRVLAAGDAFAQLGLGGVAAVEAHDDGAHDELVRLVRTLRGGGAAELRRRVPGELVVLVRGLDADADVAVEDALARDPLCLDADGHGAAAFQRAHEAALRQRLARAALAADAAEELGGARVVFARLDAERALADRVQHATVGLGQVRGDALAHAEAGEACDRKDDGAVFAVGSVEFGQPRADVAPHVGEAEMGVLPFQLGDAAQRGGADDAAFGELSQGFVSAGERGLNDEGVARIFSLSDSTEDEIEGQLSRHVLETVDDQGGGLVVVAGGAHGMDLEVMRRPCISQGFGDFIGLHTCEEGLSRADMECFLRFRSRVGG